MKIMTLPKKIENKDTMESTFEECRRKAVEDSLYVAFFYGNKIKEEYDKYGDGTLDRVNYWTYDANGNLIKFEGDNNGDGTIDRVYYYTYDANGNLTKQEYSFFKIDFNFSLLLPL